MSNSWFQFRQFIIHQDKCAMKVSTDACIQGAWTPIGRQVKHVLDIGTGTGLLSLMLAQRSADIQIDAVELDRQAYTQACGNVLASPWADRIKMWQQDIRTFQPQHAYDLIICNPPFFNNSLLGDDTQRNSVRHTLSLAHTELFTVAERLLSASGYASILLPVAEHTGWEHIVATAGWHIVHKLYVLPQAGSKPNRIISIAGKHPQPLVEETLQIRDGNNYTEHFRELMRPYYLRL